ncbi:barttin [Lissotriton helveticus]
MAEDKTFRYGLIVLGFFLIVIGMFIMSVERPQVFVTFCTLGALLVLLGIVWSICQCYPKITFITVEAEAQSLFPEKSLASSDNGVSEKKCSQTPYTDAEEARGYETSLPPYDQIEIKVVGSAECQGLQSAPTSLRPELEARCAQSPSQAKVVVHRNSESDEDTIKNLFSKGTTGEPDSQPEWHTEAPLASFKEDANTSSSDESNESSPALSVHKELTHVFLRQRAVEQLIGGPPCYDDIALIDCLPCEEQLPSKDDGSHIIPSVANHIDFTSEMVPECSQLDFGSSQRTVDKDEDFYYGLREESDNLLDDESDFEQ